VNGKRQRKFFRTKDAAARELATVKKKLRKEGEKALLIPDGLRIEALDCRDRLKPYNASLKDAVSFFISHHEAQKRNPAQFRKRATNTLSCKSSIGGASVTSEI
jgi:hypothetical protein